MDWNVLFFSASRWLRFGCLILGTSTVALADAQDAKPDATAAPAAAAAPESADEKAIRAAGAAYAAAMNEGNAQALAAAWTAEGDYVDSSGEHFKARDLISEDFGGLGKNEPRHHIEVKQSRIRLITPDVAVEDGLTQTTAADTGGVALGRFTAIWVKQNDKWLLDCVRENGSVPLTDGQQLEPLAWMVGDWVGESGGLIYSLSVRWTDGNHFLVRHFAVREKDQALVDGTQYIGWDADRKAIRSWTFDSQGTRSEGDWEFVEGAWVVKNDSLLADGSSASMTSNYKQEAGNMVWTAPETKINGETVPARSVRFLHRQPAAR
ncbi:MAG: SgcJ/EcaC family oxidoreductase [Pirellulales bacterium]|nr:SgcJ/EcaC family oxidoreductase [Pirellulales bacterium]